MFRVRYILKPEVLKEVKYFKEWFAKSKNYNTKRRLYIHCIKLVRNKKNYEWTYRV